MGCNLVLQVLDGRIVGTLPAKTGPSNAGSLCIKGWNVHEFVQHQDRLIKPLIRRRGSLEETTWDLQPGARVMCACRQGFSVLSQGRVLGATRAIPLYLPRADFEKALAVLSDGPLFRVLPLRRPQVGVLITGTEVFMGLVEDKFVPIITAKVEKFGGQVIKSLIVPDDRRAIAQGIKELLHCGVDLLVTTAGLSVDPDDVTRQGLVDAGAADLLYGAPILPGAMTLLAHIGPVQVVGVPACALYFKTTSFDLLLPRLLADLARMGHGAFCLDCKLCTFPQKCPFGK